jgi:hypothetical protein
LVKPWRWGCPRGGARRGEATLPRRKTFPTGILRNSRNFVLPTDPEFIFLSGINILLFSVKKIIFLKNKIMKI